MQINSNINIRNSIMYVYGEDRSQPRVWSYSRKPINRKSKS